MMERLDEAEETTTTIELKSANGSVVESDESSEDENENLKSIHRLNTAKFRRNASMESFLTRSQRLMLLGTDKPPSPDEVRKRKVQFVDGHTVHEIPRNDDADIIDLIFLTEDDFDRMDADMKLTHFRWQNHMSGKIPFDYANNTLRGLEFFDRELQMAKDLEKYRHRQQVLGEYVDQKKKKSKVDSESIRRVSLVRSTYALEKAMEAGAADEVARRRAWEPLSQAPNQNGSKSTKDKKKKKNGFHFWKKVRKSFVEG